MNLRNARYREDPRPIQEDCTCYTCQHFSRAYLRHLILCREMLGPRLNTTHNIHFLLDLMRRIREAIVAGTFDDLRQEFWARYRIADPAAREYNRARWNASQRNRN